MAAHLSQSALLIGGPLHEETREIDSPILVEGGDVYFVCEDGNYRYQGPDAWWCEECGCAITPPAGQKVDECWLGHPRPA